jgi:hypothetical protein
LYQVNRISGFSLFLFHSSDTADIASIAAAKDHPEFFVGDGYLGDKNNFNFYSTLLIPFTRFIAKFTGDYASPLVLLVGLHIFLQALGFYLFGLVLFKSRYWAYLLAIITLMYFPLGLGDFWGIYYDSLPRVSFQALLPYLLAAVYYYRLRPFIWPWIFGAAGLLICLHPLSTICWGLSIWLGFWILLPNSWNLYRRIGFMLFVGFIFSLVVFAFVNKYMNNHVMKVSSSDYNAVLQILKYRFPMGFLDIKYAIRGFFSNIAFVRVLVLGFIGMIYLWLRYRQERKEFLVISLWLCGIIIISVFAPYIDQLAAYKYKSIPMQFNLVRNFRYIFPLMLMFCLWPFVLISRNSKSKRSRRLAFIIGFLLVFIWSSRQMYKHILFLKNNNYYMFDREGNKSLEIIDMLNSLKQLTPRGSKIFTFCFPHELAVRYYALRPLVYSFKDGGMFAYSNYDELLKL